MKRRDFLRKTGASVCGIVGAGLALSLPANDTVPFSAPGDSGDFDIHVPPLRPGEWYAVVKTDDLRYTKRVDLYTDEGNIFSCHFDEAFIVDGGATDQDLVEMTIKRWRSIND